MRLGFERCYRLDGVGRGGVDDAPSLICAGFEDFAEPPASELGKRKYARGGWRFSAENSDWAKLCSHASGMLQNPFN